MIPCLIRESLGYGKNRLMLQEVVCTKNHLNAPRSYNTKTQNNSMEHTKPKSLCEENMEKPLEKWKSNGLILLRTSSNNGDSHTKKMRENDPL